MWVSPVIKLTILQGNAIFIKNTLMQDNKILKYLTNFFRGWLIFSLLIAILQNYFVEDGSISLLGVRLNQFYEHSEVRILPLVFISFYLVPLVKKWFNIEGNFYLSEFLIVLLASIDAFTHVNGFYSSSYELAFYGRIWFDKIMHFNEGLILLPAFLPLIYRHTLSHPNVYNKPRNWAYLLIVGYVSIFFIVWEIIELFIDRYLGKSLLVTSYYDTSEDLTFAYLGFLFSYIIIELLYISSILPKLSSYLNMNQNSLSQTKF